MVTDHAGKQFEAYAQLSLLRVSLEEVAMDF